MITPNKITKSEAKHILKLLEQATRAEIMARLGLQDPEGCANYYGIKTDIDDKIRRFVFGTGNLATLGLRWGLLKGKKKKKKKIKVKIIRNF